MIAFINYYFIVILVILVSFHFSYHFNSSLFIKKGRFASTVSFELTILQFLVRVTLIWILISSNMIGLVLKSNYRCISSHKLRSNIISCRYIVLSSLNVSSITLWEVHKWGRFIWNMATCFTFAEWYRFSIVALLFLILNFKFMRASLVTIFLFAQLYPEVLKLFCYLYPTELYQCWRQ